MYKDLKSYQMATIVYDYSVEFCRRHIKNHKIVTQMEGAARDGQENIVEASENKTSEKIKVNLLGASRFSLGELLGDYENFLRQNRLKLWGKNDPEAVEVRKIVYRINRDNREDKDNKDDREDRDNKDDREDKNNKDDRRGSGAGSYSPYPTYYPYKTYLNDPEKAANVAICLIHQAKYLVDQQLRAVEKNYLEHGSYQDKLKDRWKTRELKKREEEDEWLKRYLEKPRDG
ncbi:MAG: four helix bundle protein [Candidatus Doudnabacteria bacterium]|nr:four helix bundle protein [Candidatus Doudnabacteria bacterium]